MFPPDRLPPSVADDDPEGAEAGYREARRLAAQQGSPVLKLLAALALAKFLNSQGRVVEAYEILSRALEGFSPTPHLPAITEAQTLLAALAASEPVAAELRKRETRSKLHAGYALATMTTKGFGAEDTKAALMGRRAPPKPGGRRNTGPSSMAASTQR